MFDVLMEQYPDVDVLIKYSALPDCLPKVLAARKLKKSRDYLILELERNPDIFLELGRRKERQLLVGFVSEIGELEENAISRVKQIISIF